MNDRSTPPQAASEPHAQNDDGRASVSDIDDLIVRIRAAHDQGVTIEEIHAAIAGIVDPAMMTADDATNGNNEKRSPGFEIHETQTPSDDQFIDGKQPAHQLSPVRFPLPAPTSPATSLKQHFAGLIMVLPMRGWRPT